ncbi:MAG TPA: hypothetical protein DCL60_03755 [Armatimonadetes bacterium]|nr:hypothetical protein [Armatimonadota bacterium]
MVKRTIRPYSLIAVALAVLALASAGMAGTYKDRNGSIHQWTINPSHALIWEGSAYLPFGIVLESKYLASGQTEENYSADSLAVQTLKSAGIGDIILRAGKGISAIPPEAVQRVIDLLESAGIRYGVEISDPPYTPLTGYVIQPSVNRYDGIRQPGEITRKVEDTKTAVYVICDARSGDIASTGQVVAAGGQIAVPNKVRSSRDQVLLYYPQKVFTSESRERGLPDLWSSYDHHRDNIVGVLSKVKFGPGLRFFIDPFSEYFGVRGDVRYTIPASPEFRMEYTAWLARKYGNMGDLDLAWGILQHDIASYAEAARLIPLWQGTRGVAAVYDDITGKYHKVDTPRSSFWSDFAEFRAFSVRAYMDGMADVVKRSVAEVPVVYTASGFEPFFVGRSSTGFDGLAVPAADGDATLAARAGRVFSMSETAIREEWIISRLKPADTIYGTRADLYGALNTLRGLGTKGFFLDVKADSPSYITLLGWLSDFAKTVVRDKQFAGFAPRVVYYPASLERGAVRQFTSGVWWLPSLSPGMEIKTGGDLAAYIMVHPVTKDAEIYVWSPKQDTTIHLAIRDSITVVNSNGESSNIKQKNGRVAVRVGRDPVALRGVSMEQFIPVEAVEDAMAKLSQLMDKAKRKLIDTTAYEAALQRAQGLLSNNQVSVALDMVRVSVDELSVRLRGLESEPVNVTGLGI